MCTLGKTDAAEMKIKLITDEPVVRGPYRMRIIEEEILRKLLEVLLINGITPEKNSRSACEVKTLKVLCRTSECRYGGGIVVVDEDRVRKGS
jgi:hypothetical protein